MLETTDVSGALDVRMPSFFQIAKAGFAFALGASFVALVGFFVWYFIVVGLAFTLLAGMGSRPSAPRATTTPAVSRSAPSSSSEFEQRVQRIQRERADLNEQMKAIDEARRREKASRSSPGQ